MKKIVMALLAIGFLASCGGTQTSQESIDTTNLTVDTLKQDTIMYDDTTIKIEVVSDVN